MSITLEIHPAHPFRIVPLRFRRATTGNPNPAKPEVDDRGFAAPEHGPVVGMMKDKTITVRLTRLAIEHKANLFLTSSDPATVKLIKPAAGKLPHAEDMDFEIKGLVGGDPKTAKIQARLDSATGPILHELTVRVYNSVPVTVTPHLVTISDASGTGIGPIANVSAIMTKVQDIWSTCGVTIRTAAAVNENVTLSTAGVVKDTPWPGELATIVNTNSVGSTINVYFVNQIGVGQTLGYGFSRSFSSTAANGIPKPGILLGDQAGGTPRVDVMHWANDLAHEIGHFFQLWHPENKQPPNEREDTWSRRKLMHNFNHMWGINPWPRSLAGVPYANRPVLDDVGYGNTYRGCMLTMKKLPQLVTDGDVVTARATIQSSAGPY